MEGHNYVMSCYTSCHALGLLDRGQLRSKILRYRKSGTFDCDFNLAIWHFFFDRQTKVPAYAIFKGHCGSILRQSKAYLPN